MLPLIKVGVHPSSGRFQVIFGLGLPRVHTNLGSNKPSRHRHSYYGVHVLFPCDMIGGILLRVAGLYISCMNVLFPNRCSAHLGPKIMRVTFQKMNKVVPLSSPDIPGYIAPSDIIAKPQLIISHWFHCTSRDEICVQNTCLVG